MTRDGTALPGSRAWGLLVISLMVFVATALLWADAGSASATGTGACYPPRTHAPGDFNRTIDSGGLTREYVLHVPTSYSGEEAMPLLFNLHAFASNPSLQDIWSELPAKGEEAGFIVVSPLGTLNADGWRHWNSSQLPDPEPDDVAFISELLSALESQLCVDSARVFSTGLSNGAGMSSQLACSLSDRIAAIAPVAGAGFFEAPACSSRPVPVIAFHGTADPLIPLEPIEDTVIPAWAAHNGCAGVTEQNPLPGTAGIRLVRYEGCDQDALVELYVVFDADLETPGEQGGGHTWPGSTFVLPPELEALLGLTTHEISANDLMWDFFMAHPHPSAPKAVGGISVDLGGDQAGLALETPDSSGGNAAVLAGVAAAATAGALALGGAAWYARRRKAS